MVFPFRLALLRPVNRDNGMFAEVSSARSLFCHTSLDTGCGLLRVIVVNQMPV